MVKRRPKQWVWSPSSRPTSPTLDAATKAQVQAKTWDLIDKELKPRHVKQPPEDACCPPGRLGVRGHLDR